ncbi:uncharacterized membrane protein YhaH (DUF805 family) [Rhizobium leguminosarum]|nr:uncharacterized membrane protein YhaH (DUF805 family) [Rhizobium leguminosarum]
MGFTEAVRTVLKQKYATFSGRASRSEYWWFMLFYVLTAFTISFVAGLTGTFSGLQGGISALATVFLVIGGLFIVALILPLISLQVRRFHDRNMSGWWYLALVILRWFPMSVSLQASRSWLLTCFRAQKAQTNSGQIRCVPKRERRSLPRASHPQRRPAGGSVACHLGSVSASASARLKQTTYCNLYV